MKMKAVNIVKSKIMAVILSAVLSLRIVPVHAAQEGSLGSQRTTLYRDTLKQTQKASNAYLSDGIYKLNGEMLKVDGTASMSNEAITHKLKLIVKKWCLQSDYEFKRIKCLWTERIFKQSKVL